jgi:pimeloyl-ACP methyl ester carboxylesterase
LIFVLIHGAWHGGWKWRHVAPLLRKAGHEVYAPSLTGLGDRKHLANRQVDLATHVEDVVQLLEMHDLRRVVLVGHSYGGMVITGVADRLAWRLSRLVYLDAFVPENGRSAIDYVVPERAAGMREQGERSGWITPPPMSLWGLTATQHLDFVGPREVRHPYASMTQPVTLRNPSETGVLPKTFIYCSSPATGTFDQFAAKYRNDPAWRFHELKTGHDAMVLMPEELARILQAA